MQITGLLLKAKIGRYLMRNGGGLDANIQFCAQARFGSNNNPHNANRGILP